VPDAILTIYGPTASGKTAVARAILDLIPAEVVSADAAALFRGLEVLTAAPNYPVRLVGIFDVEHDVSVAEFQRLAFAAIDDVLAAGRSPIVVGGTGLYLRAALADLQQYVAISDDPFWRGEAERQIAMIQADLDQSAAI